MAKNTDVRLQNQVIYSIYVRNHTEEGTFAAVEPDLARIRALGTDIIWLMPIHPIGEKAKKGSLGCPYSISDYRTTNPAYGTMEEFKHLVDAIHAEGMKCIIDVVFNHTSADSKLSVEHPEFFYRREDGSFGNKIGDWSDVIDLDYSNRDLWDYQIETLVMWGKIVDGFRCDVASFVPVDFWKEARAAVAKENPDCIWLAETVHRGFGWYARKQGIYSAKDTEVFEAFDMEYEYDIREVFEQYMKGEVSLSHYLDLLNFQECTYPENYNKLRYLENHDTKRIAKVIPEEARLINYTAMLYFQKGTTLLYAGQEFVNDHTPSLFEKEPVEVHTGKDLSGFLARMSEIKHELLSPYDYYEAKADDENDIAIITRDDNTSTKVGVFSLCGKQAEVSVNLPDGPYINLIDKQGVIVVGGKLQCKGWPIILTK